MLSIICHSQTIKLCGAPGARGGWHAPCLVARGQRTLSRQGHQTERERERERDKRASEHEESESECGPNRAPWPISSHDDVGAGHELHSAAHGHTTCSRKTGYVRLLHERRSGVQCPPASEPAARARHTASSRQRHSHGGVGESDWESLNKKWITRQISAGAFHLFR
jgi:hypothetical protein